MEAAPQRGERFGVCRFRSGGGQGAFDVGQYLARFLEEDLQELVRLGALRRLRRLRRRRTRPVIEPLDE